MAMTIKELQNLAVTAREKYTSERMRKRRDIRNNVKQILEKAICEMAESVNEEDTIKVKEGKWVICGTLLTDETIPVPDWETEKILYCVQFEDVIAQIPAIRMYPNENDEIVLRFATDEEMNE